MGTFNNRFGMIRTSLVEMIPLIKSQQMGWNRNAEGEGRSGGYRLTWLAAIL